MTGAGARRGEAVLLGVPKISKKSPSVSLGLPKAPFPKSLGAFTPSHAQVAWLRHPWVLTPAVLPSAHLIPPNLVWVHPTNVPAGPPLWAQRCPPPQWGGQQGCSPQHRSSREADGWGQGEGGGGGSREVVSQTPPALPLAWLPPAALKLPN